MHRIWPWLWLACPWASAQVEPVEEEVRVRLRDVRVHVLDAGGQPVRGLRPERFSIEAGGRPREISFFEEVVLPGGSARARDATERAFAVSHNAEPRCLVFVIESGNMNKAMFRKCIEAIGDFIQDQLPPGVTVKLVQIEETMVHLSSFTQKRQEVLAGLARAEYGGGLWKQLNIYEREIVTQIVDPKGGAGLASQESGFTLINSSVQLKANAKERYYRDFYANMLLLARILKPLPGSKSVFLLTGGSFLEEDGIYRATTPLARKLGRVYNEANATIYGILQEPMLPLSERLLGVATQRFGPGNNSLSYKTLQNASTFPPIQGTAFSYNTVFENRGQLATGPSFAAKETGGLLLASTDNRTFSQRLPALFQAANHYYRLGFTFLEGEEDDASELEIALAGLKENQWKLHYGKGYEKQRDFSQDDEAERSLEFEAMLLLGGIPRNDLDSLAGFYLFQAPDEGYRVPVYIETGGDPLGDYEIGFAALGAEGELLDLSLARGKHTSGAADLLFYDVLISETWPHFLRGALLNLANGRYSFFERRIPAFGTDAQDSHMSEILLAAPDQSRVLVPMNELRESDHERDRLRIQEDPLLLAGNRFIPVAHAEFPLGAAPRFFFQLKGIQQPGHRFELKVKLQQGENDLPAKAAIRKLLNPHEAIYHFEGSFETGHLQPGEYALVIRLAHPESGRMLRRSKNFSVIGRQ